MSIFVTLTGNVILVKLVQPLNALLPMAVTGTLPNVAGISTSPPVPLYFVMVAAPLLTVKLKSLSSATANAATSAGSSSSAGWTSSAASAGSSASTSSSAGSCTSSTKSTAVSNAVMGSVCCSWPSDAVSSAATACTGSIVTSISTAISKLKIRFFMGFSSCVLSRSNVAIRILR